MRFQVVPVYGLGLVIVQNGWQLVPRPKLTVQPVQLKFGGTSTVHIAIGWGSGFSSRAPVTMRDDPTETESYLGSKSLSNQSSN